MKKFNKYKKQPYKQGAYTPVNSDKYIGRGRPEYRSSWELKFFTWCDRNPNDGRYHRYYVDNAIALQEGNKVIRYLVEIKPYKQTLPPVESKRKKKSTLLYESRTYAVNQSKWAAAKKFATAKGMNFIILTENELNIK